MSYGALVTAIFFFKFVPVRNFITKVDFSGEKHEFLMKYITENLAKIVISGVYQGYIPLSLIPLGGPMVRERGIPERIN